MNQTRNSTRNAGIVDQAKILRRRRSRSAGSACQLHAQTQRLRTCESAAAAPTLCRPAMANGPTKWFRVGDNCPPGTVFGGTHGGIATDKAGHVYVSTQSETGILVYSPDGALHEDDRQRIS